MKNKKLILLPLCGALALNVFSCREQTQTEESDSNIVIYDVTTAAETEYNPWGGSITELTTEAGSEIDTEPISAEEELKNALSVYPEIYNVTGSYTEADSGSAVLTLKEDDGINAVVMKTKDGEVKKAKIHLGENGLGENEILLTLDGTDYTVYRHIDTAGESTQTVYGFEDGDYCAVKVMHCDYTDRTAILEKMDSELKDYIGGDFTAVSVNDGITLRESTDGAEASDTLEESSVTDTTSD